MHAFATDDDFSKETTGSSPNKYLAPSLHLPPIQTTSTKVDEIINSLLPSAFKQLLELKNAKENAQRVDGCIIGTGEADFTKGNTIYIINHKGKVFQLIDVPGIEGDESKYVNLVYQAVRKAHMVFYINGTNKKPEKGTAEKIREYLRCGTKVCPIINMRGNADAYEFEEDRKSLEIASALQQTTETLNAVLGKDVLLPGLCTQGLLAFSSLAINPKTRRTTIHSSRNKDLVLHQQNYIKHFSSEKAMFKFSQIQAVADVLGAKIATFREDIIESNKVKVRELLNENNDTLKKTLSDQRTFISKVAPEHKKCKASIISAVESFERLASTGKNSLWREFFNDLSAEADKIVENHFGDNALVQNKIEQSLKTRQEAMVKKLQELVEKHIQTLQEDINKARGRFIQDVKRIDFQQRVSLDGSSQKAVYRAMNLDMSLGWKGWGGIVLNIGGYALSGAVVGSIVPVVGNAIGAAIGAVVGIAMSVVDYFTSKEKKIRKAQMQIQKKIDEIRDQVMQGLPGEIKELMAFIRKDIQDVMLSQVDAIFSTLTQPCVIIEKQIELMTKIQTQLEKMPHGTIHAIQR